MSLISDSAQHTETDVLQELKSVIPDGWPDFKEDTPLAVRDYWPFRDELNVQNVVQYRGQCIIIPKALRAELLKRIHSSHIGGEACYAPHAMIMQGISRRSP